MARATRSELLAELHELGVRLEELRRRNDRLEGLAGAALIIDLDLPLRLVGILERSGRKHVRDLTCLSWKQLLEIDGVSARYLDMIEEKLDIVGLSLYPDLSGVDPSLLGTVSDSPPSFTPTFTPRPGP